MLAGAGALVVMYAGFVVWLLIAGRRSAARALAGLIPDCLVLVRRLLGDGRLPRRRKAMLVAVLAYLAMPIDLVPDFIPVAGQLDDALLVAIALRSLVRGGGEQLVREHWPGPESSLQALLRLTAPARRRRVLR
jgi:uncharacterized membrane protein YkvA (DUF1232 family)